MNDTTQDGLKSTTGNPQCIATLITGVHRYRDQLYQEGMEIAQEYTERRAERANGQFCNLNLMVRARNEGRSVQMQWVLMHFRKGRRIGTTVVPKPRSTRHFDRATLRRYCPESMHEAAVEAEMKVRPLRDRLARLTVVERELRCIGEQTGEDLSALYGTRQSDTDNEAGDPADINPFPEA